MTILARSRSPPVTGAGLGSRHGSGDGEQTGGRDTLGCGMRWSRRWPSLSGSATSGSPSSSNFSRRVTASASSATRTRLRDPLAGVPSRCGRATSSDCGRRSSARPFCEKPLGCDRAHARSPHARIPRRTSIRKPVPLGRPLCGRCARLPIKRQQARVLRPHRRVRRAGALRLRSRAAGRRRARDGA